MSQRRLYVARPVHAPSGTVSLLRVCPYIHCKSGTTQMLVFMAQLCILYHILQDHLESCRYSLVLCQNAGCIERVRRGSLEQHMTECKFMPTSCEWCHKMVPLQDKEARCLFTITERYNICLLYMFRHFWSDPLRSLSGDCSGMPQPLWYKVSQERGKSLQNTFAHLWT